jgi:hypothetical protein
MKTKANLRQFPFPHRFGILNPHPLRSSQSYRSWEMLRSEGLNPDNANVVGLAGIAPKQVVFGFEAKCLLIHRQKMNF